MCKCGIRRLRLLICVDGFFLFERTEKCDDAFVFFFAGLIVLFSCLLNIYYPLILYVSPNVDGLKFGITTKQRGVL